MPPSNPSPLLQVCDLGLSTLVSITHNTGGTTGYQGPEFFTAHPFITTAADVYALGVVLHELQPGECGNVSFEEFWHEMVEHCIQEDPKMRPSCAELAVAFEQVAIMCEVM
jgi:serine/threonine protein kinase